MILSVKKTLDILEFIAQNGNNVRLTDISTALNMQKTTAANFLKTLCMLGYVEQDKLTPRYRLTHKMHLLMAPGTDIFALKKKLKPKLEQIMRATGETTYLSVQMGTYFRHELKCEPNKPVRISLELGRDLALLHSATGKIFMAHSVHLQETLLRDLDEQTADTVKERLKLVIKNGYADDFEEHERELNCVALPVFENKRLVATVGISGPAFRFGRNEIQRAIEIIKQALDN